jgi:hypothetical protein
MRRLAETGAESRRQERIQRTREEKERKLLEAIELAKAVKEHSVHFEHQPPSALNAYTRPLHPSPKRAV